MPKKKYNAKAREIVKTSVDDSEVQKIKLDFARAEYGADDSSNVLALPSKKRASKVIKTKKEHRKLLSKAQRKQLEKVLEKKEKKLNRANLLEKLVKVQASSEEMALMTSITTAQTLGVKRIGELSYDLPQHQIESNQKGKKIKSIAGARKRKRLLNLLTEKPKVKKYNPNIVGISNSSSSDESSSDEEIAQEKSEESTDDNIDTANVGHITEDNVESNETHVNMEVNSSQNVIEEPKINEEKPKVESLKFPNTFVQVDRDAKIQISRLKLPILGEEQKIMEAINENEIVIIAGETGSGKTTQVPQFLYEAGYALKKMIGVTEPRRVATVAMAARVGYELGLANDVVSYLMRFEGNVTEKTKIKFMTDGVLLKEIQSDMLLSKYSVIIIDEAHERSVFTDILLGLLSRIVPMRKRKGDVLRLIIMSATLRVEEFTKNKRLFKMPPPVIQVDSRQYPVTTHFAKKTNSDYMKEAYKMACKVHNRLPDGGILIFVTGKQEVHWLIRKLRRCFPYKSGVDYTKFTKWNNDGEETVVSDPEDLESEDDEVQIEMKRARKAKKIKRTKRLKKLPKINLDDFSLPHDDGLAELVGSDDNLDSDSDDDVPKVIGDVRPVWALPLYSMLKPEEQIRVFDPQPAGTRLCIVSTDVAETSLTIPGIRYVIDTGKKKNKLYDQVTGVSCYRVGWTSQASAAQRAGRAGRTSAGHCYRLYSSAVFQHEFKQFPSPDLLNRPIDDLVLQMSSMGIDKIINFPFPTSPDRLQLRLAQKRLRVLGLLEPVNRNSYDRSENDEVYKVSPLGVAVSAFPVLPRFGKMLALSHQHNLLTRVVTLVASLSVPELLPETLIDAWLADGQLQLLGDPGVLFRIAAGAIYQRSDLDTYSQKYQLSHARLMDVIKLFLQLKREIELCVPDTEINLEDNARPLGADGKDCRLLRQLMLSAFGDQVAKKIQMHELKEGDNKRKFKYAYHCGEMEEPVHLHSGSILKKVIPEWVIYGEVYTADREGCDSKTIMKNVCAIEPEWLPVYVPELCNMREPLAEPEPHYEDGSGKVKCHMKGTFGKAGWELPIMPLDYPDSLDKYKWFARFILEGKVFKKLAKFTKCLLSPPSTMVKSWAKLQPRTDIILKTLLSKKCSSRNELLTVWETEPKFLLASYLKWLPESSHNEAALVWPPL